MPSLLHHWPALDCEVKVRIECQWRETSSDLFVVAREELQIVNSHLPIRIVSNEGLHIAQITYLCAKMTYSLSPNSPIIRGSMHFVLKSQEVGITT